MPTYDYICASCGQRTEFMHGVHAPGPEACPRCGGGPMRKAMHAPTVHFKGSGWAKKERASSGVKPAKDAGAPAEERSGEAGDSSEAAATASGSGVADGSAGSGESGGSGESASSSKGGGSGRSGSSKGGGSGRSGSGSASKPAPAGSAEA